MHDNPSILRRLRSGFAVIAVIGSGLVMLVEFMNFELLLGHGREQLGIAAMAHEVTEHVLIPAVLILLPLFLATRWVLRTSLAPLILAADRMHAAADSGRGFHIDRADVPLEALPFVDAINSLLRRLDQAAVRLEAFAADAAHELRTPLTILGLELRRLDCPAAERLYADVQSMSRLVEQLLMIAQLDAVASAPLRFGAVRLRAMAEEVVMRMAPMADAEGKEVILEVVEEATVTGEGELIQAAIRNLVENALRATPAGTGVTVIVGPGSQIRVRDQGPGLSDEQLERMSQRFIRADRRSGGAGIGLAIVSKIAALHGGSLGTQPQLREIVMRLPDPKAAAAH